MSYTVNSLVKHRTVRQFLKFGITGVIGATVDYGIYIFLTRLLGWEAIVTILGFNIIAANMVSVLIAIVSNFLLNKYWTFRDKEEQVLQQGLTYFGFNTVTWVLNQMLTSLFTFRVALLALVFGDQRDLVAKALAIGVIMFVNFFGSKFLIFRKPHLAPQTDAERGRQTL